MEVITMGFDTLVVVFECSEALPLFDLGFRSALQARGIERKTHEFPDRRTRLLVECVTWRHQSSHNESLRLTVRHTRSIRVEFSAARLKRNSPHNLDLASADEAYAAIEAARSYVSTLLPEAGVLTLQKISQVDVAADVRAGRHIRKVIELFSNMPLTGSRKLSVSSYRGQGVFIKGSAQSFTAYPKGIELETKLSRRDRKIYAERIDQAKAEGRLRLELRLKPRGGANIDYLHYALRDLAERLEKAFPNGWAASVGSLGALINKIDGLDLRQNERDLLLADTLKSCIFGLDYIKDQVRPSTFRRKVKLLRKFPIHFAEDRSEVIQIDLSPIVEKLKAA